jgi:hypothetical protein
MCNFPSWIITKEGQVLYLTDADIEAHGIALLDGTGHSAIIQVFGPCPDSIAKEGWPVPLSMAKDIADGKFNKIMKELRIFGTYDPTTGFRTGIWKSWHKNGPLSSEGAYNPTTGFRTGIWRQWQENGELAFERTYDPTTGFCTGTWKSWHKNGQLSSEGAYDPTTGFRTGIWRQWHENGQLASEEKY